MCRTTTPPHAAAQNAIRKLPPNSAAAAVIPLESYLQKYVTQFNGQLVPATKPTLPSDVDQNAYKRVAFSLLPLRANAVSPYYAGNFNPGSPQDRLDDDTDFSASLIKVAALFAACQLLSAAKAAVPASGADVFKDFNAALKAEINANADPRILSMTFPSTAPVALLPKTSTILTGLGPTATFTVGFTGFTKNQTAMIVDSDDPSAAVCIDRLGYGLISAVLIENKFFDPNNGTGVGVWLAGDYEQSVTVKRIQCVNDHPDTELTTTRQMCRMFAMIQLNQLPKNDSDTNQIMQDLLGRAGTWLVPGAKLLGLSRGNDLTVTPRFSKVLAKVGFAGLGTEQRPNVYSEGLVIEWSNPDHPSQIDDFNKKIDPDNASPDIHLSGKIAVCWQNLLAQIVPTGFDGIVEVLNNTISDFLDQKAL